MIGQLDPLYIRRRPKKALKRLLSRAFFEGRQPTMRGQWVNSLLNLKFKLLKKIPVLKNIIKPIFIVGIGRSGTTILSKVLSFHQEVGLLNEAKALWHAIYPFEDILGSYGKAAFYRLCESHADAEVVKRAKKLHGAFLYFVGAERLIDKYPEMIFRIKFIQKIYPDAKIVLLIRNGWDVVHSISNYSHKCAIQTSRGYADWWGVNRRKWHLLTTQVLSAEEELSEIREIIPSLERNEDMAAVEWMLTMREAIRATQLAAKQIYTIRYEDLTSYPYNTLKKLIDFCELSHDKDLLDYAMQVLKPMPMRGAQELHPIVRKHFLDLLKVFGY